MNHSHTVSPAGGASRRVLLALIAMAFVAGGCAKKEPKKQAGAKTTSAIGTEPAWVRGLLVMTPETQTFRPCNEATTYWVDDRTGGDLGFAFEQLGTGPERPAYVEIRAAAAPPVDGPDGGHRDVVTVTGLRLAAFAHEGGGCDEARATWEYVARGNEPFWSVTVTRQVIVFAQPEDPTRVEFPYVPSRVGGGRRVYTTSVASPVPHMLELWLEEKRCTDTMAGEILPYVAEASFDGRRLRGCAVDGDLAPLSDFAPPEPATSGGAGAAMPDNPLRDPATSLKRATGSRPAIEQPYSTLAYINQFVGLKAQEVGLLQTQPLAARLALMLGPRFETLLLNTQEQQPLAIENGAIYLIGNKMLAGATDAGVLVADVKHDVLYVWLKVAGETQEYRENDTIVTLPRAVRAIVGAAAAHP